MKRAQATFDLPKGPTMHRRDFLTRCAVVGFGALAPVSFKAAARIWTPPAIEPAPIVFEDYGVVPGGGGLALTNKNLSAAIRDLETHSRWESGPIWIPAKINGVLYATPVYRD